MSTEVSAALAVVAGMALFHGCGANSRIVFLFRKKTEYFFNCEYPQNDPLAAEIETGCDQVMQSFRRGT